MTFTATGIALSVETKATTDNNWQSVSQVSVQVGGEVKAYDVQSTDPYTTATLTSDNPFYWQNTAPIEVTAWWPTGDVMPQVVVQADQSTVANYQASDYLQAQGTVQFQGSHDLQFTHRTAKVVVNPLVAGSGMTDSELAGAKIALAGVSTGSAEGATVTPYQNSLALLPQQQIPANEPFIQVTLANGTVYSYKPDAEINLEAGKQYTYTITVKKTGLGVDNATISSWDNTTPAIGGEALPEVNTVTVAPWGNGGTHALATTRATTDGTTWTWADGDQVSLSIGGSPYTLAHGNGGWSPESFTGISLPATAEAWWPSTASASEFSFQHDNTNVNVYGSLWLDGTVDQSTPQKLAQNDWMTSGQFTIGSPSIGLTLRHRLAKVTVTITSSEAVNEVRFLSYTRNRIDNNYTAVNYVGISPYATGNNTYTAIVSPYYYNQENIPFMWVTVGDDTTKKIVYLPRDLGTMGSLSAGNAYTFNLTVNNTSTRSAGTPECELKLVEKKETRDSFNIFSNHS